MKFFNAQITSNIVTQNGIFVYFKDKQDEHFLVNYAIFLKKQNNYSFIMYLYDKNGYMLGTNMDSSLRINLIGSEELKNEKE